MPTSIHTSNFDKYLPKFPTNIHSKLQVEDFISSDKGYLAEIYDKHYI